VNWLQALSPSSIYVRTTGVLLIAFLTFAVLILLTVAHFTILPLARSAGDDLAALMLLSARSWAEIPPPVRPEFNDRLYRNYGLRIRESSEPLPPATNLPLPYLEFVQESLSRRAGFDLPLRPQTHEDEQWFWADLTVGGENIRIGLSLERVKTRHLEGVLAVLVITALLVLLTSVFMAGRTTRRIRLLSAAVAEVSKGQLPASLPDQGPREVRMLTHNFNRMAHQVRELLANRTTLLAGISHDLRTPSDADAALAGDAARQTRPEIDRWALPGSPDHGSDHRADARAEPRSRDTRGTDRGPGGPDRANHR
jgi:two-component system, OmpR family, osmolarity sensor histidine kinase EnvZ